MTAPFKTFQFSPTEAPINNGVNVNFDDVVGYLANRNSGAATWDALRVTSATTTVGIFNNSTGTNDILRLQDNGSTVFSVVDGGSVYMKGPRPWYDVRAYGATGDGSTDDSTSIQNAINAAEAASGGLVFFPAGNYRITTTLTIKASGVHLLGAGRIAAKLTGSSGAINHIKIGGLSGTDVFRCSVQALGFSTGNIAIQLAERTAQCFLEDLYITSAVQGIVVHGDYSVSPIRDSINHAIRRIEIEGATGKAIELYHCGDIYISEIQTPSLNGTTGYGLVLDSGTTAVYATNCNFTGGNGGINIKDSRGISPNPTSLPSTPRQSYFYQVQGDTCTTFGWQIEQGYQLSLVDCWGCGCTAGNGYVIGDGSTGAQEITLDTCHSRGNALHGYKLVAGTTTSYTTFVGCDAISNGTASSNTYNGFEIEANIQHFSIVGCKAYSTVAMGLNNCQKYGINVNAGTSNYYMISGNVTDPNVTAAVNDGGTGTSKFVQTGEGPIPITAGGTGAASAASARTNLGLGSIATQNSNNVTVTGGSITGITDLAVADGGTGASTAANARTNLGFTTALVQTARTTTNAVSTTTTSTPYDDTIPQNTEGAEFMTCSITPLNSANRLRIHVVVNYAHSTTTWVTTGLHQDSAADALAAVSQYIGSSGAPFCTTFIHEMAAGTTSSTTFKVRMGGATGATLTFNGVGGSRQLGGVNSSSITIEEIA